MNYKKIVVLCVVLVVLSATSFAHAVMTIRGYDEKKHDRFYSGEDREFIGESFDWSGVGKKDGGAWATMVSPRYFLTSDHAPASGTITFYENNTKNYPHNYTVDSTWSYTPPHAVYGHYDLCLRRLTGDIDDSIAFYPVLALGSDSEYIGMEIYANGKTDRVGRNIVDVIEDTHFSDDSAAIYAMGFDYDGNDSPSVGDDECLLQGGDSGGPSFAIHGGSLALVGIHSFSNLIDYSGDNFVPHFIDELNANMGDDQLTLVPEPSTLMLLVFCAAWLVWRRIPSAVEIVGR